MARILLAVIKEGELAHRAISYRDISTTHEIAVFETLTAACRALGSEHFDLVVCDVGFDDSQMFDLWAAVRRSAPAVMFLAYRERDSDLGEAMELLVRKTLSDMGLAGYLDMRDFKAPDDCRAFLEFIELGLQSGKRLKKGRINDCLLPSLGIAVKNRRLKLGMSLEAFSEASGLKLKLLNDLENGKQTNLELNEFYKLADGLNIAISKLLVEAEEIERFSR